MELKRCETELIRVWHIELAWAIKLADDSIVSEGLLLAAMLSNNTGGLYFF